MPQFRTCPTFETAAVRLRPPRTGAGLAADVAAVVAAVSDPETGRWLSALPWPYERRDAERFLAVLVPDGWARSGELTWVLADPETDALVGCMGLHAPRRAGDVQEVGYWVAPAARGRGVATTALRRVCAYAFADLGLSMVTWQAMVGNVASRRVAEKAGFRMEGTLRARLPSSIDPDGPRRDVWVGSLLPEELTTAE